MDRKRNVSFDPSKLSKAEADRYSSSDSDSDEDDDFQIPSTNPGADEFLDYNPRKRRRTGRDAKESAALGIFGSESEDDGPSSRWKHKPLHRKGMTFVSSAAAASKKDTDDEDEENDGLSAQIEDEDSEPVITSSMHAKAYEDEEDDEDEDAPTAGLGLGSAAQRVAQDIGWGMGNRNSFAPPGQPKKKKNGGINANAPLGRGFVPTSSFAPELKAKYEDEDPEPPQIARPSAFSSAGAGKGGKKGGAGKINPNSFGAKMMAKMGWAEGAGLGKEGQGRNVIVEVNLRPQRAGLGAVKEKTESERQEEKRQARLRGEVVVDSDEEEKKRKAAARRKKMLAGAGGGSTGAGSSAASTPKRQKQRYLTLDEVKKAAPGLNIPDAFTPILDLTGPGRKVLTSSSGLMTPTAGTPGAVPETAEQAESRKLARRAQNDFMAILEEWQGLQERKAYAELQLQQERQELEELEKGLVGYRSTVEQLNGLSLSTPAAGGAASQADAAAEATHRWDHVISLLKTVNDSIPASSKDTLKTDLAAVAIAAVHPVFKAVLQNWDPLADEALTTRLAADITSVGVLLGVPTHKAHARHPHLSHRRGTATPYDTMIYKLWLPHVARAVREWDVRDPDPMLALYEAWSPLLPGFVRSQLLEQDIVRRLDDAVAKWEPKKRKHHHHNHHSSGLPHTWLFPWLQHLPARHLDPKSSTGLVADVKRKFRQLVDVWEFRRGVVPGLAQWRDVLRPARGSGGGGSDQWRPLLMNHVLPGMARYLRRGFEVDPAEQDKYMDMLTGVLAWSPDLVAPSMTAEVLVAEVFPKWHRALYDWLVQGGDDAPDPSDLLEWLEWWRNEALPSELSTLPSIEAEFTKGESLIEAASLLGDRASTELEPPAEGPALRTKSSLGQSIPGTPSRMQPSSLNAETPPPQPLSQPEKHHQPASFRDKVDDFCQQHDLQFIPERTKVHAKGPLYRITARGDGKGGLLVYFEDEAICFDTADKGVVRVREMELYQLLQLPALAP